MTEAAGTAKKRRVPKGRHLSQIKRQRQNEKLREANLVVRSSLKTALKKVRLAVQKKDKSGAQEALRQATSLLYRAASKKIVHSRNASRHVARLSQSVAGL